MSGGSERGLKVLLLLGVSAAAAFAVQLALSWISKRSDSKTSKKDNTKTIETDSEEKIQTITSSEYPTCESDPITKNTPNMSQPLTSSEVEVNITKTKNNLVKSHKEGIVFGQRSWSDIIEDEDSSTKIVVAPTEKCGIEEDSTVSSENVRAHHDSGVVSPQNEIQSSPIESMMEQCSITGTSNSIRNEETKNENSRKIAESSNTIRHEERTELDAGLGSSECGEDVASGSSITGHKAENQQEPAKCSSQTDTYKEPSNDLMKPQVETQRQTTGSDSGQGSEADDGIRMAYHFYIPSHLCGKMIGKKGETVKQFKNETKCSITLQERNDNTQTRYKDNRRYRKDEKGHHSEIDPFELQICIIQGTRNGIDRCLELIREKFPLQQYQELTLEQINTPQSSSSGSLILSTQIDNGNSNNGLIDAQATNNIISSNITAPTQLGLDQGAMHEVYVSAIVSGGHAFLQQPNHPTYFALSRLESCMYNVYTRLAVPDVPRQELEPGLVCAANWSQQWYRVQVVNYDASSDNCYVRFLDYGGYYTFLPSDLKQIRSDFLALPFQALEVYLGNVIPPDQSDWPVESAVVLEELVANQIISGRMLGVTEDFIPIVHLYGWINVDGQDALNSDQANQQPRLLNRELVDRGVALWTEHIIAST